MSVGHTTVILGQQDLQARISTPILPLSRLSRTIGVPNWPYR